MTLNSALASASSGLAATSRRADLTASNIANASTPGYVRRELVTEERVVGGRGQGVTVVGVNRAQDMALSRDRRDASGSAARADIISQAYTQLNREMGEPGDTYGLFASYQNVETSLRDLAVTPESLAYQNDAYNSLNGLTTQFSELYSIGIKQRVNADNAIARDVQVVNQSLHRISQLNEEISKAGKTIGGAASLEDERQRLLDKISQIIPIKDLVKENGQIEITTQEGLFLIAGVTVRELEFTPAGVIPPGATYAPPVPGLLSGITVGSENLTPGNGSFGIQGGSLAGYFAVRDQTAPNFLNQLDSLAADLVNRFTGATVDPTNGVGAAGIITDNGGPVVPLAITGIASRLRLNAAIDPNQGGTTSRLRDGIGSVVAGPVSNADILNSLLDAFTNTNTAPTGSGIVGDFTSTELAAGLTSLIGEARINADALAASSLSRATTLADIELSQTGVDTDAEMQNLLVIEQSYAANARVIQTISEMIDILMQI
ncbi:MAG: flagellar hook-associated protein FlgK [Robiginitomaculum sp.]|nr:MAG: flagellar hook-associated protein FlgK [Robiginitomaculum sp.]